MEILQLIQLHNCFHGENGAADSTAFFLFSFWEGLGRAARGGLPRMKNHNAVESATSFSPWKQLSMQLTQLHHVHIFYS